MSDKKSYSSANVDFPVKLLRNRDILQSFVCGQIRPVHIQFMPTNECDAHCTFCSCKGRDKSLKMNVSEIRSMTEMFAGLGTRAVTITGGGDPMLHPDIYDIMSLFSRNGIEIGLVSNARKCLSWNWKILRRQPIRWIRISVSDEYPDGLIDEFLNEAKILNATDIALSYVVTARPNPEKIRHMMQATNENGLSHIRFVFDINRSGKIDFNIRETISDMDTSRAIIQERSDYRAGNSNCWISLLKPVVYADGNIYPCCGVQYANEDAAALGDMHPSFRMGNWTDANDIWRHQWKFDGSKCAKCYYYGYNEFLQATTERVKHVAFV